eukprot:365193-Chlamydomonas_euryale.AAC.10
MLLTTASATLPGRADCARTQRTSSHGVIPTHGNDRGEVADGQLGCAEADRIHRVPGFAGELSSAHFSGEARRGETAKRARPSACTPCLGLFTVHALCFSKPHCVRAFIGRYFGNQVTYWENEWWVQTCLLHFAAVYTATDRVVYRAG